MTPVCAGKGARRSARARPRMSWPRIRTARTRRPRKWPTWSAGPERIRPGACGRRAPGLMHRVAGARRGRAHRMAVAVLDIDGTLVDTNYHHAVAWFRAFRRHGIVLPVWRIHRHIGMGGDQVVKALTDERTEEELGDAIRDAEKELYFELIDEVEPMDGARDLIEGLGRHGHVVVLASSAKVDEVEHYLDLLDARDLADAWTSSADVEATKPAPDLVNSALQK